MTNCKNCGAPIDIYADTCPWCGSPYEMSSDEVELKRQKAYKDAIKAMQMYGSEWGIDDDYEERAARYSRGEKLEPKYIVELSNIGFSLNEVRELIPLRRSRL